MRLPRVMFVIGSLSGGGSERQLARLLEAGHGVRFEACLAVFAAGDGSRNNEVVRAAGVPMHVLAGGGVRAIRPLRTLLALVSAMRQFRPDVAYPWLQEAVLLTWPAARLLGVPMLVARRNTSWNTYSPWKALEPVERRAERAAVLTTANAPAVVDSVSSRGIPLERIRLVRNGHPPLLELPPIPSAPPVRIGCLARLAEGKGHDHLLEALALVRSRVPWKLVCGGDGPLLEHLRGQTQTLGLADRVEWRGLIDRTDEFWAACHFATLLSESEGSPNVLIEAAFAGRPSVATEVGGVADVLGSEGGLLVPPGDRAAAARAFERLIDDAPLRERLAAGARQHVVSRFTIEHSLDDHCTAIENVIALARR
jgi:glycosyltransferase involved in cell wall biosynthesis